MVHVDLLTCVLVHYADPLLVYRPCRPLCCHKRILRSSGRANYMYLLTGLYLRTTLFILCFPAKRDPERKQMWTPSAHLYGDLYSRRPTWPHGWKRWDIFHLMLIRLQISAMIQTCFDKSLPVRTYHLPQDDIDWYIDASMHLPEEPVHLILQAAC